MEAFTLQLATLLIFADIFHLTSSYNFPDGVCDLRNVSNTETVNVTELMGTWYTWAYLPSLDSFGLEHVDKFRVQSSQDVTGGYSVVMSERLNNTRCVVSKGRLILNGRNKLTLRRYLRGTVQSVNLLMLTIHYESLVLVLLYKDDINWTESGKPGIWVWKRHGNPTERPAGNTPSTAATTTTTTASTETSTSVCIREIVSYLQNTTKKNDRVAECSLDLRTSVSVFGADDAGTLSGATIQQPAPGEPENDDNRKVFAVVAGVVACVIILFVGAFLLDKYWKPGYRTLR